jgi:hypothetical protein
MKKVIALTLAVALVLSAVLFFPSLTEARVPAGTCFDNWDVCRGRAFQSEEGVMRTTILLTVCDVGLGKCLLGY